MLTTDAKLVRTLLSKKPAVNSGLISLLSVAVLAVIFAVSQKNVDVSGHFTADYTRVFSHHEFWRAITSPLLHANVEHLGSNALFFGGLAYLLNGYFGLWAFPVMSILAGGLINLIVLPNYPPDTTIVGVSGIVCFMAAFWLALYFGIERGISKIRRLMNTAAFAMVLFIPEVLHANVSYLSHAVGFGLGIIAGTFFFAINRDAIRTHEVWKEPELILDSVPGPEDERNTGHADDHESESHTQAEA